MTAYARVASGIVVELFTPPSGVSIAECFHADIAAQFVEVPDGISPQQGWTYSGGTFAAPPHPPPPTLQQQAEALLASPVTVQCASAPALNGDYAIDMATQMQITSIAAAISAGLGLPGGGVTFNWPDVSGSAHSWPAAQFTAFAKAIMNFVYNASQVVQGHSTTLPSAILEL